jgi:hypothetical protein
VELLASPLWAPPSLNDLTIEDLFSNRVMLGNVLTNDYFDVTKMPFLPEAKMSLRGTAWSTDDPTMESQGTVFLANHMIYHLTPAVREHAIHIAEHKDVESVRVWEEPCGTNSAVVTRILVFWKPEANIKSMEDFPWLDLNTIGEGIEREFPDWKYMPGALVHPYSPLRPTTQIMWVKDKHGIPYSGQLPQKITPRPYSEYKELVANYRRDLP